MTQNQTNFSSLWCGACGGIISGYGSSIHAACNCPKHPQGWECPRCNKIHSPYSLTCNCPPRYELVSASSTEGIIYPPIPKTEHTND